MFEGLPKKNKDKRINKLFGEVFSDVKMAGDIQELAGSQYSPLTGLIYIFNLIVGTGALTLPAAFHDAGWLLSMIIIILLAFMSYLTATFVIESMASANAMVHWKRLQRLKRSGK